VLRFVNLSDGWIAEYCLLNRDFLRRMVEFLEGEGKGEPSSSSHIYQYVFLKHLVLFSADTVEKYGFAVEKNEN
jgi:hypothetical protein